jgi:type IV pilus assembly protein PilM
MFKFLKIRQDSFGLDISDNSLRFVKIKKRRHCYVSAFGEKKFPKGILKAGEIIKEEEFVKVIKDFISKNKKIKTKNVIASLPEEKSYIQMIKMPKMSSEELKTAIIFEAENYIPMAIENVYLDAEIIKDYKDKDYMDVLIAALPKTTVDPYVSSLKKAGLNPIALEIESLAVSRILLRGEKRPIVPTILVDFGENKTSFIIYANNAVLFTSSFVISSAKITDDIVRILEISSSKANKMKIKDGISNNQEEKVKSIILKEIEKLVYQIQRHSDYYTNHGFKGEDKKTKGKIERVIITGGGSKLKGLINYLTEETGLNIELKDPCKVIKKRSCKIESCYSYSTALGLALRGELEKNSND